MLELLETGHLYCYYRRKLEEDYPLGAADMQRFMMVLNPLDRRMYRVAVLGVKRVEPVSQAWRLICGFINKVAATLDQVESEINARTFASKSRHERHFKMPHLLAEGVYSLMRHEDHTHFAYSLEILPHDAEIAQEFSVVPEACYHLKINNPTKPSPVGMGLYNELKAEYPPRLQRLFTNSRYLPADRTEFLDYDGTGVLLVDPRADTADSTDGAGFENELAAIEEITEHVRILGAQIPREPLFRTR
jgi:hypothetical protein